MSRFREERTANGKKDQCGRNRLLLGMHGEQAKGELIPESGVSWCSGECCPSGGPPSPIRGRRGESNRGRLRLGVGQWPSRGYDELVPDLANRADHGLVLGAELGAEAAYVHVHRARAAEA